MNHDQKCRVLKMVLASLQHAVVANGGAEPNKPADSSPAVEAALTEAQVSSALYLVNTVLKAGDDPSVDANLSATDIAALVLQILQLILSHFPQGGGSAPSPAPKESIDATSVLAIIEAIMQALELILAKLPKKAVVASVRPEGLSAVDIAGLVLAVLQLLLSKFGTQAPTPAPAPAPTSAG